MTQADNDTALMCVLDLLSASVYPVHQLVSILTLLIQVHLQLIDPLLQTPSSNMSLTLKSLSYLGGGTALIQLAVTYLHDLHVPGFVFFGVASALSLQLQFLDLLLQHLLFDHGLVSLPLILPQVFLLMHQLKESSTLH